MARRRHERAHAQWWWGCIAVALAVPAHAEGPGGTEGDGRGPAPEADEGSDLEAYGNPRLLPFGYYDLQFRVDQHARIAVRCLGVEGARSVTVRFRFEVDNTSERDVDLRPRDTFLQWSREARAPDQGPIRPRRVDGPTRIPPGESGKVFLHFEPRGNIRPEDIHYVQLRWTVRSGYGARPIRRSSFVREVRGEQVAYPFVPHMTGPLGPPYPHWRGRTLR